MFSAFSIYAEETDTHTRIINPNFKTLQVHHSSNEFFPPVITLNSEERIEISFDEMASDMQYLRYRLIHCNSNWQPSELLESEYLEGFNYANIEDYGFSSGTFANYVNYSFTVPNDQIILTKSGNYLVQVYPEDNPDETLLQARFYVNENFMNVIPSVTSRTDIDANREHQQVSVKISCKNARVRNWQNDIKLFVNQNSRTDNEVMLTRPNLMEASGVLYQHDKRLIFPAGNEFRRFEVVATNYPGLHVENIQHHDPFYHVDLFQDATRNGVPYAYDETQFGRFKIRQSDAIDSNTDADYVVVHFSLEPENIPNGDIYIDGELTNHLFTNSNKMRYNPSTGKYELQLLLKMGSYNYQYLWKTENSTVAFTAPVEGNHYQTVNEYSARIYYRPLGERYDRLVGFGTVFSGR